MKQKIKLLSIGLILGVSFAATPLVSDSVSAQVNKGLDMTKTKDTESRTIDGSDGLVKTVINIMLWVIGIISVIMIIIGGIRYATSNGDSNAVTGAKNTIMYAVIGLVIAIFAYAIVNFVLVQITG